MVNNKPRLSSESDKSRKILLRCTPLMHTRIVLAARDAGVSVNKYLLCQIEKDLPYARVEPTTTGDERDPSHFDPESTEYEWDDDRGKQHQSPG